MSINILVVEDDDFFREAVCNLLASMGHRISAASDGLAAQQKMLENNFDVVLTDVQMPKMTGIELLSWSRAHCPTAFIVMTGFSSLLEDQSAHDRGAREFLHKPFKNVDLLRAIERITGKPTMIKTAF